MCADAIFPILFIPLVYTDKHKDKDQYIKDCRTEIKVELEILSSFPIHGFPALAFFDT